MWRARPAGCGKICSKAKATLPKVSLLRDFTRVSRLCPDCYRLRLDWAPKRHIPLSGGALLIACKFEAESVARRAMRLGFTTGWGL